MISNCPLIQCLYYNITLFVSCILRAGSLGAHVVQKGMCALKRQKTICLSLVRNGKKLLWSLFFFSPLWNLWPSNMTHLEIKPRHKQRKIGMGGVSCINYIQWAPPKGGVWCVRTALKVALITEEGSRLWFSCWQLGVSVADTQSHSEDNTDWWKIETLLPCCSVNMLFMQHSSHWPREESRKTEIRDWKCWKKEWPWWGLNKANNNTCTLLFKPLQRKTKLFPFYILSQTQTSKIFFTAAAKCRFGTKGPLHMNFLAIKAPLVSDLWFWGGPKIKS